MQKARKLYLKADQLGAISPMSTGQSRASLYRLAQERDWDAYHASLPVKAYPKPKALDLSGLVQKFNK